jgi:hypothetical protein
LSQAAVRTCDACLPASSWGAETRAAVSPDG